MSQQLLEGYRLSPQQRRLFVLHPEAEKQRLYGRVRLRGPLDATLLSRAFEQVVSRHESLRTSFHVAPGMELPLQIINEECGFGLEQMTAAADEPISEWAAGEWQQWCSEEGESAAGGLRVRVLQVGEREHELWLSVPELCADRRGLENLVREVAGGYEQQLVGGRETRAEDEPAQYLQFSEWQNELLETAWGAEGRAYWQAGALGRGELRLPLERAVREGVRRELQRERLEMSAAVVQGLAELSEEHGSSLEELLLGSWYLLLWRLTGETEIEVEVQMDGRKFAETEKALGRYDLPVPVRLEIVTDYSVIELLEMLRTNINQARGWQEYYNWEEHYATAGAAGERIGFSYSEQPQREAGSELEWEWEEVSAAGEAWKLELRCERQESVLVVEVSYESGRYEAAEMQWLVKRYERVLAAIAGGKQGVAADVEIVSEEEREQQLVGWNQTGREYESEKCIQQLFEAQVERTPEAVALVYQDEQLSYAELNERANQLAHYLRGLGVGPEVLVGICVERSIEMVVAMLATLKAGGAYLPLDPDYPLERLALMIDDSGPSVVLTLERIAERLPAHCGRVYLDTEWEQIAAESSENPECLTTSDNLCYLIYTSGSTGRPKGVTITHENLINSTTARAFYHAEPGSRFLLLSSFAFDSSVAGIFGTLCWGATLCLPREGVQRDIEELERLIAKSGISCLLSLPSLYALLLEYSKPEQMSSLRAVIVAGESCPVSLVERHFETLPQASLFNEYGPTEATVWSTVHECRPEEARIHVPIGRPIANTQIYLIDAQFNPVAIGIAGELCIGGVGLSRGYWQQPGLTAEKFVPHPFAGAGARLYRTGDLARFLADGSIEFLGRVDDQVKIRGYRIELGEIEALLSCHPHVRDSMVIVNEAAPGKQLVAYFVPAGKPPAPAELRNYFQQHLPEYMIPAFFVQLSELPLTPNGKVDRRALLPKTERKEDSYEAAQTPLEEIVAGIWSELLGVSQFGRHDNFFEMGGHSLLATQFISRLREVCGVGLAVRVVFESPTVAELAQAIEAALRDGQGLQVPAIVRRSGDVPPPLSFAQQRLWFIDQMEPGNHSYNIPAAVRLSGELNVMALEQTLSEIVSRHESLRTTFTIANSEPVQVIAPAGSTPLLVTDLSLLADTEREEEARRLVGEEARAPFDLSTGPLFRAQLLRLSETEHILLCTMHHVVSDGWSMGVLIREVAALYQAYSAGEPSPLKELTIQYADFAAWQREWLTGEVLESQLSYWKQQLQGAPAVLELPTDRPRPAVRSYRGARHSFQLSAELSAGLKELSRREGATLFMVLLAAFDVLLSRYTGQDDIVVGTPVAGRNHREIESLIGFFINTLVLRVELSAEPSFREVVRRVREVSLGAYAHQDIPFEKLVEELQPERALSHQPLFQVVFTMQNAPREGLVLPGLKLQPVRSAAGHAKFDLQLTMVETGGRLAGTWSYSTEIFEAGTIQRMAEHFQQLLAAVVAEPEAAVCSVALLTEAEREQQLVEWNQTTREYASESCVQQLFEAQVERTPEALAVVYEAEQLTYEELNERANQLAHYLRALGVGPEVLVGICVERSLEMVVGVLGILKAGGAYVPLDAEYPLERLSFMLEDAGVGVLLTQARLEEKLPAQAGQVVCLDSEWEQIAAQSTANPECLTTAENLCYVIYTSGSTGRPKGVEIEQRGLVNYVNWSGATYPFGAKGRTPVHSSLSFDLTVTSLYVALVQGGCLELIAEPRFGLSAALEQGAEFNVLKLTPGQLQLLNLEVKPAAAGRVKALVLGGENLLRETVTKWLELNPGSRVFNEYGPTETVVGCCIYEFKEGEEAAASVPIGGAIANSESYLLDERGALLPVGASGELYIGGAGVGRGYLHRPDLTAERFVPHPYSTRGGERLYRTGDVGRYRPTGTLEYLGRLDQQVKVRGYRVELGEVEAVLNRHSGVQECVVVAREEESGDKRLVAYVVTDSNMDQRDGGPERPLYQMPNDLKVAHLNKNETDFVYEEIFKNECYLQHGIRLNDGDCIFDVGANIGLFTLFVNQRCANAQVYAFEPVPATFAVLRTNVELYGLSVKLFNCGLFSEPTTLRFTHYPRMSVMSGAFADPVTDEDVARITMHNQEPALSPYADGLMAGRFDQESYDCPVRTISGVMREEGISRIDLLKIDVEKSELEVLKGIAEEDWEKIRQIVVEVHELKGEVAEVEKLLAQHGFKFVTAQDAVLKGTGIYDIYALHPARQRPVTGAAATATELLDLRGGMVNTLGGELRRYLQEQLPEYMVPSAFVQLNELPLTRNGKVDRGALPAPEQMQATSDEQYVAPRTGVEEIVAGIWSEVLKVERLGRTDNFFDLGGHSLLATQVISRVREICGVELAVRVMFESPTLAELAQAIEAALREEQGLKVPAIVVRASETAPPLSFAQQRLWFIDQLEPGSYIYNIPAALRLSGELNVMALEQTLSEIVSRHEVLRTSFTVVGNEPVQVIAPVAAMPLPITNLSLLADDEREAEARRLVGEEARQPFDLGTGPLFRAQLLRLSDSEHILLCTMHHVVSDGWSIGVLIREVAALYQAFSAGAPSPLKELTIQYADFAAWQREWLTGEALEKQLTYWKGRFGDTLPLLELPTDRPHPTVRTYRGDYLTFDLGPEVSAGLKELSRREGATLFMVLLAGFKLLLSRYCGQDDIVVGTAIANRNHREIEELIGFFVNTLVMPTDLSGDPSFLELVSRVRDVALGAYTHQDVPFEKLVEDLMPERNLSYQPLFQVMFALQNVPAEALEMPGLILTSGGSQTTTARFDLVLAMKERSDRIYGSMEYSTELFDHSSIQRLVGHFQSLLAAVIAAPDQPISTFALLDEREREQQLVEWNQTGREYASESCVQQLFEAQVASTPEAVAVVYQDEQLSYGELNERANQLAHYLRGLGVGPEVLVGICVERSLEMVVGVLGILKAGGAYVPLDAEYPLERLSFMLEDAGVAVLLTQARLEEKLPAQAGQVVCLDSEWEQIAEQSTANPECLTTAENLCYVIYTSGSTGEPKGVLIPHRGVTRLLCNVSYVQLDHTRVLLQLAPLSFDASTFELWGALLHGGSCVLWAARLPSAGELRAGIARYGITTMWLTASLFNAVVDEEEAALGGLKQLLIGGEALSVSHVRRARAALPEVEIINGYGPTESTTFSCCESIGEVESGARGIPIGRAIANTEVYVLDQGQAVVPVGVVGELYIGGAGLARGYLNQPELTAEKFVKHPFSEAEAARLYRTGDLVRYLSDGRLEFMGRLDSQVKVRGYRIELGEIEAVLSRHSGVKECVVVAREEEADDKRLIAYVVQNTEPLGNGGVVDGLYAEHITQWETFHNTIYGNSSVYERADFNITGWNSSFTGHPIPEDEMREWVSNTTSQLLSLKPRRVLEIGCGTGLLLFSIAPHCAEYYATDFSRAALECVHQGMRKLDLQLPQVSVLHKTADNFDDITGTFDIVILNSVVQYFPSIDYLFQVLEKAVAAVAPGGSIFVGDVRSLPLLEAFHTTVELYRSPVTLSVDQLRRRIQRNISQEEELVIDPAFFRALQQRLPQITQVAVRPKRGRSQNEMTQFRYDVTLRVGDETTTPADVMRLDWQKDHLTLPALRQLLEQEPFLEVNGIPNARLAREAKVMELLRVAKKNSDVNELREAAKKSFELGVELEDLWALTQDLPANSHLSISVDNTGFCFDVMFQRYEKGVPKPLHPGDALPRWPQKNHANNPLLGKFSRHLVPKLRNFLETKLPEYMIPAMFVLMDSLPLTSSGKINRRALPAPTGVRPELESNYVTPRTALEELVTGIWSEVLGVELVGIHDNFFDLGGHSLLATQVISRIRETFRVEVPLRCLFESPTVSGLALDIAAATGSAYEGDAPPITPAEGHENLPLSFAQQRLWFIHQLEPNNSFYNIATAVRLSGDLDIAALEQTLSEILRRHESLRTSFTVVGSEPVQVIAAVRPISLPITDLSVMAEAEREAEAHRLAGEEAREPFDLSTGPLFRAQLLRLSETEHVLLCTMHHVVSDGWSMGVLIREVGSLYQAFSAGEPSPLPELNIQYPDFAAWQRQWLTGEVLESQLSYWKQQLQGAPAVLELPTDRPRPAVRSYRGAQHSIKLSEELSAGLKELSRREGATLFMVLLAAFDVLLSRYTGQDDIVVGSPIANRNRAETEALIGFFVNTLVLRTDLSSSPTFRELLGRVREVSLGAYAHQDIPFEKLVEELQPQRDLSRSPLFQVMFVLQNAPSQVLNLSRLTLSGAGGDAKTAKFDLTLMMMEQEAGMTATWVYNTDIFDASRIERLAAHFQTLLERFVLEPEQRVTEVLLVSEEEREQQLVGWNQTAREYASESCLQQLFEAQVERTPEAVAVVYEAEQLTYAELNARANQLAHYLRGLGVGPEVLVGLCLERSLEMLVGVLGILKAGGAYVPLDPSNPAERLGFMLADAAAPVLVTQSHLLSVLPEQAGQIVCVDGDWPVISEQSTANPACQTTGENLCYVIYTSGSTGQPKGVLIPHRALVNYSCAFQDGIGEPRPRSYATVSTFAADLGHTAIFPALCTGAVVHVMAQARVMDGARLAEYFAAHEVECMKIVPSHLRALFGAEGSKVLPRRVVVVGGEGLRWEWARAWAATGGCRVLNHYGPTECTVGALMGEVGAEALAGAGAGLAPLGRALGNTEVYVLDKGQEVVPVGVVGELYLGGAGLARGYLNQPELTAEKFVKHPFSEDGEARLYRTGDLVRYLSDGRLEFVGRLDHQVKVRGYRVELGEVETALNRHSGVKECVVVAREEESGDKRLVAYVVPASDVVFTPSELRSYLKEKLPEYMVPSAFVELVGLPLTRNGKVDHRALPPPDYESQKLETAYLAPRTPTEERVAAIWSEVLRIELVSTDSNFFEIGGHSLLATQVVSRLREACRIELPLRKLFEFPTVAGLSLNIDQMQLVQDYEDPSRIRIDPRITKTIDQLLAELN